MITTKENIKGTISTKQSLKSTLNNPVIEVRKSSNSGSYNLITGYKKAA